MKSILDFSLSPSQQIVNPLVWFDLLYAQSNSNPEDIIRQIIDMAAQQDNYGYDDLVRLEQALRKKLYSGK